MLGSAGSFELRASIARHRDSAFPSSLSRVAAPVRSRHFSCSFVRSRCCLLMATCMSWAAGIALSPFRCAVRSADLLPLSELASLANHLLAPTSLMSFAARSLSVWHTSAYSIVRSIGGSARSLAGGAFRREDRVRSMGHPSSSIAVIVATL